MITELTTEQKAAIPAHIEKWNKVILSTEPINLELAKESVIKLYEFAGLKQPKRVIKISSPLETKNINNTNSVNYAVNAVNAVNAVRIAVWNAVYNAVSNEVESAVYNSVYNAVSNSVYNAVRNAVNNAVGNAVDNAVNNAVRNAVRNAVYNLVYGGSMWPGFYAHYSFYRDILNIKLPEIYNNDEQLALNSTFSLLFENTAYICEKPKSINIQTINNRIRLHNTSGPAVLWRDNFKQWYIEGIPVDEQIVMKPETQTIKQIDGEGNEERRRIRIEQYGWIQYLEHSKAKLINSRINERDNQQEQLYEHEQSNRFICVDPSTGRKYAIAVPHTIKTCLEAQKYLSHGLDKFAIHRS